MKHLYRNFEKNNFVYRNPEEYRRSDDNAAKKAQDARNKLRETIPAHRSRQEAEEELQSFYDDVWKIRERVLKRDNTKNSAEMVQLKDDLSELDAGTSYSLWVFVERKDGLPGSEKKWFQDEISTIQSEIDAMWDVLGK